MKKAPTGSRRNSLASIQVIFNRLFISHLTLSSRGRSGSGRHLPGSAARCAGRGTGYPVQLSRLTTSLTSGTLRPSFPWTITCSPWTSSRASPGKTFSNAGRQRPVQAEDDPFLRPQVADQGRRGVQRHDPPVVEDGHPVAQALGLFHEMGGQHDRLAPGAHVAHQVPDGVPGLGIEAGGQLVQEDQLRIGQECQGDEQALLLPAGQFREGRIAFLFQPNCASSSCQSAALG